MADRSINLDDIKNVIYNGKTLGNIIYNGVEVWKRVSYEPSENITPSTSGLGTSNTLTLSNGTRVATARSYATWSAYWRGAFDGGTSNWWAGTNAANDSSRDRHEITWGDNPKWLDYLEVQSAESSNYASAPFRWDIEVKYGSETAGWTSVGSITCDAYTAQNQWRTFDISLQDDRGIYGLRLSAFNNSTYKTNINSVRHNDIRLFAGDVIF